MSAPLQSFAPVLLQVSVASELLSDDLQRLLKEAKELRETADSITCNCNKPGCPFRLQPRALHLDRSLSLPGNLSKHAGDCEYVSDDEFEDTYSQMCRFLRTQPTRKGSAPNRRRRFAPTNPRDRSSSLEVPKPKNIRRDHLSASVLSSSA